MPPRGYVKPKKAKYLSSEQVGALIGAPKAAGEMRDYYLLAATYFLARRIGEVVRLRPENFANLEDDEVNIGILKRERAHRCGPRCARPCKRKGTKTVSRNLPHDPVNGLPVVSIPVLPDAKPVLAAMVRWAGERRWIFEGQLGKHLTTRAAQKIFTKWKLVAGIPKAVTPHSLRHTAVSRVVAAAGIALGRDLAAHSSIAVTNAYVHVTEGDRERSRGSLRVP